MRRRAAIGALVLGAGCSRRSHGTRVRLAVGGAEQLVYLPTTLAQQLGHYREQGLDVTLQSFAGGAKALQALLGGSADAVSGFYDHTIQMAAEGRALRSFVTMLRYPGFVAVVSPAARKPIARIEDLRGAIVGVTAPGSSTHLFAQYLLARKGLPPDAISAISIGATAAAVAAVERGKVDAAIMTDPAFTLLEKRHSGLRVLADVRAAEGVREIFGTEMYPSSVFYSTAEWIAGNADVARRLAVSMRNTLRWIQSHSPNEIMEKMPAAHHGGDPAIYLEALRRSMPMFSPDGRMSAEGAEAVKKVLSISLEKVREANVDVSGTFTNEFVS